MDSITYFVLSREARVYDGGVGLGSFHFLPRFDSPDDAGSPKRVAPGIVWGAKAKPPVFTHASGGFAV
jgi:hypothetical protein